jgi:hypothetical protein
MIPTDVEAIEVYLTGPFMVAFEQWATAGGFDVVQFPEDMQHPDPDGDGPRLYFLSPNEETMRRVMS